MGSAIAETFSLVPQGRGSGGVLLYGWRNDGGGPFSGFNSPAAVRITIQLPRPHFQAKMAKSRSQECEQSLD
jgi:hypothetical protein